MRTNVAAVAAVLACTPARDPARPADPPSARKLAYAVITVGRHSGEGTVEIAADGTRTEHFTFNDRGRGPDVTTTLSLDGAGAPIAMHATGHDYLKAPVDETLASERGELVWKSTLDQGRAPAGSGWYVPNQGPFDASGLLAETLRRAPNHKVRLLPGGEASIESDRTFPIEIGGAKRELRQVAIGGVGFAPGLVWLDDRGDYFGEVSSWISTIRTGAEEAIPKLLAIDDAWRAERERKLAESLAHRPPAAGLAFVHADVFDSERATILHDATVVVAGDAITAVGDARTPIPAGARVIDAKGKTLLPGLWDMHQHLDTTDGALDLASGITTVRDLGNDIDTLSARVQRYDAGTELGPRVVRAGLVDGSGPFAAPTGVLVDTEQDALAAVKRFADLGYAQVKIYSSVKPALVPVIAAAAHARGLRVSGHIPTGMNAAEAVEAGYDELQHANLLFLRFLATPADDTRTPLRFTRVAEGAADLDLDSPEVQQFLDLLVAHKTVLDPTLAVFEGMFVSDPGELTPVLVPYAEQLAPQVLRGNRSGGLPAPDGKRAKFRASSAALGKLVKRAWDRKITIVAGTDSIAGLSLSRELERYVESGIPAADVLALATLGAARVMKLDRERGSIAVGKRADLVLVDGDPTREIARVRDTRVVVCRGIVYDPAELFVAAGMRARVAK